MKKTRIHISIQQVRKPTFTEIKTQLVSGKERIRSPNLGAPNLRGLPSRSLGLCLQAGSVLTGRPFPRGAEPQAGAPAAPARTGLPAQGARAHAAARARRRRRRRRHGPSFPFRESPANILCPCLGIYVMAAGPGPPEMAVAPRVGSPEPAPPLLYKWGGPGLGEPGCALERRGAASRGRSQRARAPQPPDPFSRGERPEPGARAPRSARRGASRLPASLLSARPRAQRARPPAPRSRRRAMLHLSEFSGPDALLVKSAEGCCSEPSTELPRLAARDAAAGYPGGKERGRGCSDGGAVRGRTVPETGWDVDAGAGEWS